MSYQDKKRRYQKRQRRIGKQHQEIRDAANRIHELEQKLLFAEQPFKVEIANLKIHVERLTQANLDLQLKQTDMLLWCPECHERHIDVGEFETKSHHTHACQHCGHVWRPAIAPTRGVQFLPGKNREEAVALIHRLAELRSDIAIVGYGDRPREIVDELITLLTAGASRLARG